MKLEERPGIKKLEKAVNINWVKIAVIAVLACLCIKYSDHVIEMTQCGRCFTDLRLHMC